MGKRSRKRREKKQEIELKEWQDSRGISRRKKGVTITFEKYNFLKFLAVFLIPLSYILFSDWLYLVMIFYIATAAFAVMAERHINRSLVRTSHFKLPKADCILAIIVLVLAFVAAFGSLLTSQTHTGSTQTSSTLMEMWDNFTTLMSGRRNIFTMLGMSVIIGVVGPPSNAPSGPPPRHGSGGLLSFDLDDLPLEYLSSQLMTVIITVLTFAIPVIGLISVLYSNRKYEKFQIDMRTDLPDEEITLLGDAELDVLLSFGEEQPGFEADEEYIERRIAGETALRPLPAGPPTRAEPAGDNDDLPDDGADLTFDGRTFEAIFGKSDDADKCGDRKQQRS